MAKIYEATLIPTGTTDLEGNYCGYQWCEREAIEGVDSLQGYVSDLDDVEVLDNVTVHNMPAGAIVVGLNGTPCSMIWEELGE